jgi:hypothetical protein
MVSLTGRPPFLSNPNSMNYPNLVTREWLASQRKPDEARDIRVELTGCYNHRPVPVPGKRNVRYIFEHDPASSCHILTVPESVWMADNGSMARDMMTSAAHSYTLVPLVLPISTPAAAAPKPLPKAKTSKPTKSAEDAAMAVLGG